MWHALRNLNDTLVSLANARVPQKYDVFIAMGILVSGFAVFMFMWHPWTHVDTPGAPGRDGRDGRVVYVPGEDGKWHREPLNPVPYVRTASPLRGPTTVHHTPRAGAPSIGTPGPTSRASHRPSGEPTTPDTDITTPPGDQVTEKPTDPVSSPPATSGDSGDVNTPPPVTNSVGLSPTNSTTD